jgi:hypothetical protein
VEDLKMIFDGLWTIKMIEITGGVVWAVAYFLIIQRGFLDRAYGMPLVALCANVSWEFIFSVVPYPPNNPYYRAVHLVWLFLDLIILFQLLKYGPREFVRLSKGTFYAMFGLAFVTSFCTILFVTREFQDSDGYYSAFGQNLLMSVLFITMLYSRRSLRGQSLSIALSKMLGTALYSLALYLDPPDLGPGDSISLLLLFLSVAILLFDLIYVVMVWARRRVEARAEH